MVAVALVIGARPYDDGIAGRCRSYGLSKCAVRCAAGAGTSRIVTGSCYVQGITRYSVGSTSNGN